MQQKEITTALTELLVTKVPTEDKYACLSSELKLYNEAASTTGCINEEGELGFHTQKRQRPSMSQQPVANDEPNMVILNAQQSRIKSSITTLRPAAPESTVALHSSDKASSHHNLSTGLWNVDPLSALVSAPTSPQDPTSDGWFLEPTNRGF